PWCRTAQGVCVDWHRRRPESGVRCPNQKTEDQQAVALSALLDERPTGLRAHVLDVPATDSAGEASSPYDDLVSSRLEGSGAALGTIGLASCRAGALDDLGIQRLQLGAQLAIQTRRDELRLTSLRRLFDEVSRTLENALAVDRALRFPPTYREIARAVGESLD